MRSVILWFVRQYAQDIVVKLLAAAKERAAKTQTTKDDEVVEVLQKHKQMIIDLLRII